MSIKKIILPILVLTMSISAEAKCKSKKEKCKKKTETTSVTTIKDVAIKPVEFSKEIKATEDFYEYVNNDWSKLHPIPADKASFDMFNILDEESRTVIRAILENASSQKTKSPKGSNNQLLGDFYRSAMDTAAINKAGVQPLQPLFNEIDNIKSTSELIKVFSKLGMRDISSPFGYYVSVDAKNTTRYVMYIDQGGLGLPDKDFYFRTDEKSKNNLESYKMYISNLFKLANLDKNKTAQEQMQNVFDIELAIANASFSRLELRDPEKNYNLYSIEKMKSDFPNLDWDAFFSEMKVAPKEIILGQPSFYKKLDSLFTAIPLDQWKSYLKFHLINGVSKHLNDAIVNERFDFFGKKLSGTTSLEPRWKRVSRIAETYLRDLIGQEYVKVKFSPVAKARSLELVNNIKASLADRINNLTWMGAETKAKALDKLQKIDVKIGYPDKWWTYENTDVSDQPYVTNVMNCIYAENLRVLSKLNNEKIDRTEWGMGPQTVNAYYNPTMNEIVFPAAILQPPFFYENGDDAVNYGGIGMVIGHEITHGFDDQGSQFDGEGNLKNWWTEEDKKNYEAKTDKFVELYNKFEPLDSIFINGELTLGENIADLGGMIISYNALKKAIGDGSKTPLINGLTPEQRFFINYAIIWRTNMRPESLRMQILADEHSPAKYRINGVLANLPAFHEAFNVKPADKMFVNEAERATMW